MTFDAAHSYLSADDCRLAGQKTGLADYPYAAAVEQNVLGYHGTRLRPRACAAVVTAAFGRADSLVNAAGRNAPASPGRPAYGV